MLYSNRDHLFQERGEGKKKKKERGEGKHWLAGMAKIL